MAINPPTNCEAEFICYIECVSVTWTDNSTTEDGHEIQRRQAGLWLPLATVGPGITQYWDCDIEWAGVYEYRIRAFEGAAVTAWCTTSVVYLPTYWFAPETWPAVVLEPAYQIWLKNQSGEVVAVFDNWLSFDYTKRTRTFGYYELVLSADDPRCELFEIDGQVEIWRRWPGGDWYLDFEGFHRRHRWWMDDNDIERFSSIGQGYEQLLDRRLVIPEWPSEVDIYADEMTDVLREIVRRHCVMPTDTGREVSGLTVEDDDNTGLEILEELRHQKILKVLRAITETGGDFEVVGAGPATFEFKAYWPYRGLDKTLGNGARPPVLFSAEFANLRLPSYEQNWLDAITWVLVGGKGEGVMRTFVERTNSDTIGDTPWGRIESFVDARSDEEEEVLELRGDIHLADHDRQIIFSGEAVQIPACYYGRDWELGDLVSGQYRGHTLALLIEEVNVRIPEEGQEEISGRFTLMYEQEIDYYAREREWSPYA